MKDLKEMLGSMDHEEHENMPKDKKEMKIMMLEALREAMDDLMSGDMKESNPMEKMGEMQKVTVAAPDEESLKKGLEKAEEIVGKMPTEMEEREGEEDIDDDMDDDYSDLEDDEDEDEKKDR